MEQKKLTRDQTLIKLVRENADKSSRIKDLEKEKKNTDKRLRRLEEDYKRLARLLAENDKTAKVLKEKSSSLDHEVHAVRDAVQRIIKRS